MPLYVRAVVLVLFTFVVYAPALRGGLVWDDVGIYLTNNSLLREPDGLYYFWFSTKPVDYYPLTYSLFWIGYQFWGLDTLGYHLVNVAVHAAGALALWRFLARAGYPGAWCAALVYAVHPVNVESVGWISQLKTVLGGAFAYLAMYAYLRFDESRERLPEPRGGWRWYAAAVFLFVLSLAGKPVAIGLPVLLLGWEWFRRGRFDLWKDARRALPFFIVAIVFGLVGVWFQQYRVIGHDVIRTDGPAARVAIAGHAVWFYLYKGVWPTELAFVYPRWTIDAASPLSYLPGLAFIGFCWLVWVGRKVWGRAPVAALAWYIVMLGPALGFVDVYFWRYSFVGDHYQYPALPAVVAVIVGAFAAGVRRLASDVRTAPAATAAFLALTILGGLTVRQAAEYIDEETVYRKTLDRNPRSWMVLNNLALLLEKDGRGDEAISLLRDAVTSSPKESLPRLNL
ncbi:MAG: hypothetical protein ACRC1K_15785, partial [Planctomycetia bacterium]